MLRSALRGIIESARLLTCLFMGALWHLRLCGGQKKTVGWYVDRVSDDYTALCLGVRKGSIACVLVPNAQMYE